MRETKKCMLRFRSCNEIMGDPKTGSQDRLALEWAFPASVLTPQGPEEPRPFSGCRGSVPTSHACYLPSIHQPLVTSVTIC